MDKTNVMRLLDGMGISYTPRSYPADGSVPSGVEAARLMGEDPSHVFKTLVTQGASRRYYVFVIPVAEELSLKKAAAAVGEKSIAMLKSKDRSFAAHRLCTWRMFPHRHEKALSYYVGRNSRAVRYRHFQRR